MTETASPSGCYAIRLLPIVAAVTFMAGCSTTKLEDATPVSAVQPQTLPAEMQPPPVNQAPQPVAQAMVQPVVQAAPPRDAINTGTFPNLNVAPGTAAPQFTPQERVAKLSALRTKQQAAQRGPSASSAAEVAKARRLKRLATSHANETLQEIEAK